MQKNNLKIRDANEGDCDEIKQLYENFCREFQLPSDDPPIIEKTKVIVCEFDGHLFGYGSADVVLYGGKNYTQGQHIYIKPEFRKTKCAGLIYRALNKWAKTLAKPLILISAPNEMEMWKRKGYKTIRYIMVKEIKCLKS